MSRKGSNFERSVPALARITKAPLFCEMERFKQAVPIADDVVYKVADWIHPTQLNMVVRLIKRLRNSTRYIEATAKGGMKYDLNNQPVQAVPITDVNLARKHLRGRRNEMPFVVLVCGGRNYDDMTSVNRNLYDILSKRCASPDDIFLVEGACHLGGADRLAYYWRIRNKIAGERFPVDKQLDGEWPEAGKRRNIRMYNKAQPKLVISFPGGNGTKHMVSYARRMGCEVIECL